MVDVAQLVEPENVNLGDVGSRPIVHPKLAMPHSERTLQIHLPDWRNWQTRSPQTRLSTDVPVRCRNRAPKFLEELSFRDVLALFNARVAELADALGSGPSAERHGGSRPSARTIRYSPL